MLTKESKTVLYHLYKEYCLRRTNGLSRNDSKELGSSESVQKLLFPDWSVSDVDDCMCELGQNGYLDNHHASNIIYCSSSLFCSLCLHYTPRCLLCQYIFVPFVYFFY